MVASERTLKWALRLYPPLLFQRIWVLRFQKGFKGANVKIFKSIFNKNYNGSIFGGTLFSAIDPFLPVCLYQILKRHGFHVQIWVKKSDINFIKPAFQNVFVHFTLTDEEIQAVLDALNSQGKHIGVYPASILNPANEVCATVEHTVYIRKLS